MQWERYKKPLFENNTNKYLKVNIRQLLLLRLLNKKIINKNTAKPSRAITVMTFDTVMCKPIQLTFSAPNIPVPINRVIRERVGERKSSIVFL